MIGFLKGLVISQASDSLLLETGGVGYELHVTKNLSQTTQTGDRLSLWVHTCLRQDSLELYGFSDFKEKSLFLSLLKVKGIGPKMALKILGSCSLEQFVLMIREENIKALSALPKIGKKTAQQIVLSLKEQIPDTVIGHSSKSPYEEQLFQTLEKLGFHSSEIREAIGKTSLKRDFKTDLKEALSLLKSVC